MPRFFTEIPILDLSRASEALTHGSLLASLHYALTNVEFLYITGHAVSGAAMRDIIDALPTLFSLPDMAKAGIALANSPQILRYRDTGTDATAGRPDRREQFKVPAELDATWTPGEPFYECLRGPN
jgi:isopenicillin N synthase-like dioxygenase